MLFLGGDRLSEEQSSFTEKISGAKYIVNVKSADDAEMSAEEYIKELITDKVLSEEAGSA